ncbi:enoyl-CoA hydratase/isomerase family protein [Actinospongicola halichondriae]|uniref:enoyl-CoA hydratase/isomerase family protein n=1 Tax=Actinospongicola halichondriae TaxID=3236844 RepID=UPI003D48453B
MIDLETRGDVRVLRLDEGENRFNRSSVDAIHAALDEVAATQGPVALVTVGVGKFFSNGLDLDWMGSDDGRNDPTFLDDVHRVLQRVTHLDLITVAAVNGHAFAGGAMLAVAHDFRVMREDRGYWCIPEVDLGLPLTDVMFATLDTHLPRTTLAEASLTGKRYSGPEALAAGIVHELATDDAVLDRAVELAASLAAKDRTVIAAHKKLLHGDPVR